MNEPTGSRTGSRRGAWLLVLASVLVTVSLLEIGARLVTFALYGRATQGRVELSYFPFVETVETGSPVVTPRRVEPELKFSETIRAAQKPKDGRLRVVIIGASTARGIPGRLLATRLGELYRREVEVVNLAVPGHIVNQEVVVLGLFGLNLQPDVVVSIDGANDPVTASKTWQPGVPIPALSLGAAAQAPVRYALSSLAGRSQLLTVLRKWRARRTELDFQSRRDLIEATAQQYLQGARALSIMARGAGAEHVLLFQPYLHLRRNPTAEERNLELAKRYDYRRRFMTEYLGELAERMRGLPLAAGITFVDGTAAFDRSAETCFVDEVHLNDRGYELLVEAIAAALEQSGLDRSGPAVASWPVALPPGQPTVQVDFRDGTAGP